MDQNVLRLDVSVDNVSFLAVQKCFDYLGNYHFCFVLAKLLFPSQSLEQVSVLTVLQHYINVCFVVEIAVEPHYIRVLKSPLNFNFFLQLGEKIKLF
jgi:hypothetical protein